MNLLKELLGNGEPYKSVLLTFIGDKLGLYKAMAGAGALTPEELAKKTGTHPRMIREWLVVSNCWKFCYIQP